MMRSWLRSVGLSVAGMLLALPAFGQQTAPPRQDIRPDAPRQGPREAVRPETPRQVAVHGKVVRMAGTDQFIVRTPDNREVTFYTSPDTRYLLKDRPARYSDLRVGSDIDAVYTVQGDRYIVNSVTAGEAAAEPVAPAPPAEGTVVEGSVVRVLGDDQVIVRTADGREVVVYVTPQTTYSLGNQAGRFTDLRPGVDIRVDYDVRDRRNMARAIRGALRRNR